MSEGQRLGEAFRVPMQNHRRRRRWMMKDESSSNRRNRAWVNSRDSRQGCITTPLTPQQSSTAHFSRQLPDQLLVAFRISCCFSRSIVSSSVNALFLCAQSRCKCQHFFHRIHRSHQWNNTDGISKHRLSPYNAHYLNYNFFYSVSGFSTLWISDLKLSNF